MIVAPVSYSQDVDYQRDFETRRRHARTAKANRLRNKYFGGRPLSESDKLFLRGYHRDKSRAGRPGRVIPPEVYAVAEPAPAPVAEPAPAPVAEPAPVPVAEPAPAPTSGIGWQVYTPPPDVAGEPFDITIVDGSAAEPEAVDPEELERRKQLWIGLGNFLKTYWRNKNSEIPELGGIAVPEFLISELGDPAVDELMASVQDSVDLPSPPPGLTVGVITVLILGQRIILMMMNRAEPDAAEPAPAAEVEPVAVSA